MLHSFIFPGHQEQLLSVIPVSARLAKAVVEV